MSKRIARVLTGIAIILLVFISTVSMNLAVYSGYLPLIFNNWPLPSVPSDTPTSTSTGTLLPGTTPTTTPTATMTSTPTHPIAVGETVRFKQSSGTVPFEGVVTFSEYRSVLNPDDGDPVNALGIFVVILMDVTNHGLESDSVSRYSSFRVEDSIGRKFDMAELKAFFAAEDEYDRESVYDTIQPGFTKPLVFVFDVLQASEGLHLISSSPW